MTTYSDSELNSMLLKMRQASRAFYIDAVRTGCHPFIEFTGLMNEYINMCEDALLKGIDFTETSVHGDGQPLPMKEHHRRYLNEKLQCIYGTSLEHITASEPP